MAKKADKTAKELNIKDLHSTTYEKLPEIPGKKQALHRDHGGGVECVAGVRDIHGDICLGHPYQDMDLSGS